MAITLTTSSIQLTERALQDMWTPNRFPLQTMNSAGLLFPFLPSHFLFLLAEKSELLGEGCAQVMAEEMELTLK